MGKATWNRIMLNRRRNNDRKSTKLKNEIFLSLVVCIVIALGTLVTALIFNFAGNNQHTKVYLADNGNDKNTESNENELTSDTLSSLNNNTNKYKNDKLSLCLLGEIMMGGDVTKSLDYIYTLAFKDIYNLTKTSDFTYATFSTNITNLTQITNAKSKYLVAKDATSALLASGIDAVSIATDHIIDYPSDIIKNTINTLEADEIHVAGRKDTPVYLEKDDKKIAIISTNSVISGTKTNYTKNNISIYDLTNLKQNINQAKEQADIVIVDIHWGREFEYGVTNEMRQMAKAMIDAGADMVIGSHALGIYPVVEYKGKPIIYSLGYLIGDSDYTNAKDSFIFNLTLSKEKKVETIEMIPIYIEDKTTVRFYNEYNKSKSKEILELYNRYNQENGLNTKIYGNRIIITL